MLFIREANVGDLPQIAELEKICFPMPWSAESILHDISDNDMAIVLVAEFDDRFAGYANIWCVAGEGQLNSIAVLPEMRGKGIATGLMETIIDDLRDKDYIEISLEVRASNTSAIAVYDRLGFERVGERDSYYLDNGEEALIYKLILNENYDYEESSDY